MKDFSCKKRKEGKMDFRWFGPYCILKNFGKGIYLLQEQGTNKEWKVNGAHFKPYIDSGSKVIESEEHLIDGEEIVKNVPCNEDIENTQKTELESFSPPSSPNKPHSSNYPTCNEDLNLAHKMIPQSQLLIPSNINSSPDQISVKLKANPTRNTAAQMFYQKLRNLKRKANQSSQIQPSEIINLDTYKPSSLKRNKRSVWIRNSQYQLSGREKQILLSPSGWLNDVLITAAQTILKQQYGIAGFQETTRGITMSFDIMAEEFVQILHDGVGHWFTVSTVGAQKSNQIFVYDSLYPSVGPCSQRELAALLACKEKVINVSQMNVQSQDGGSDCGLFAIAFATALVNGIQPAHCMFVQGAMRQHLLTSLEEGRISMFPLKKKTGSVVKSRYRIKLYCECRMPELKPMIECSGCKEWFHVDRCVSVPRKALTQPDYKWFCSACKG